MGFGDKNVHSNRKKIISRMGGEKAYCIKSSAAVDNCFSSPVEGLINGTNIGIFKK